jgi:hypothetical protein
MVERSELEEDPQPWSQYRLMVVSDLRTIREGQTATREELASLRVEVAQLKVWAAIWGAAASIVVSAVVAFLVAWFTRTT